MDIAREDPNPPGPGAPSAPEPELLGAAPEAFARVYEQHAPMIHAVLLSCAPLREVPDLLQEVFASALGALRRGDRPRALTPWLVTIARNAARDRARARRVSSSLDEEQARPPLDPQHGPQELAGEREQAELALSALRQLPEAYRVTLALRLVEGLSGPEIAQRTGLTPGSVRVNLHRGMKLMRARLAELGLEGASADVKEECA